MLEFGLKAILAYLLGTMLGSLILGRLKGVDIRRMGSGNAGATNAARTVGKGFGAAVLVFDVAKGVIAVTLVPLIKFPLIGSDPGPNGPWITLLCAVSVILGHVYPIWYGFRGGKGVATILGVLGALDPWLLLPVVGCWLCVVLLTGYVGLASMVAGGAAIIGAWYLEPSNGPLIAFCGAAALFVVFTHRGNIARMCAGTEHRLRTRFPFRSRAA